MQSYPPLVQYATLDEYREHFHRAYCKGTVVTFDGIAVRFRKRMFDHCFFESVAAKDDTFSRERGERIDWIEAALHDPDAELYVGWDRRRRAPAMDRRVAIVMNNYVVVIRMIRARSAEFVTAFVAGPGPRTIGMIRSSGRWTQKNR